MRVLNIEDIIQNIISFSIQAKDDDAVRKNLVFFLVILYFCDFNKGYLKYYRHGEHFKSDFYY